MTNQKILILSCGGTIDSRYGGSYPTSFIIKEPSCYDIFAQANVDLNTCAQVTELMRKDSSQINEQERAQICSVCATQPATRILITHGTDTMVDTAESLLNANLNKTIVLVGAMTPYYSKNSDAEFNLGYAVAACQLAPAGVYIAMHAQIFSPTHVKKNFTQMRFEHSAE